MALASAIEPAVAWERGVPETIRSLDTLDRADYLDRFSAETADVPRRSAEEWVRDVLASAPVGLRTLIPLVHRYLLGLRLAPGGSPSNLFGWRVAERTATWVRLEASGWLIAGHLLVYTEERELTVATFVRYNHPLARLIWPPVSLIHRRVGIALMRHGLRSQPAGAQ